MTTISQVCKNVILEGIDADYIAECGEGSTLYSVFMEEKGSWSGFTVASVKDWLQGLPSAVAFPFTNYDILQLLETNGITRQTEKARYTLIENYWDNLAMQAFKIMQRNH